MKQLIHNDWWDVLKPQFESQSYSQLHDFLKTEYTHRTIYPEMHHIFEAFEWTPSGPWLQFLCLTGGSGSALVAKHL